MIHSVLICQQNGSDVMGKLDGKVAVITGAAAAWGWPLPGCSSPRGKEKKGKERTVIAILTQRSGFEIFWPGTFLGDMQGHWE